MTDIIYDMSRLALRVARPAPNGIDRVDLTWARHFVGPEQDKPTLVATVIGQRVVPAGAAKSVLETLDRHWGACSPAGGDPVFQRVRQWLLGRAAASALRPDRSETQRRARAIARVIRKGPLFGRRALFPGRDPVQAIPRDAIILNASQFPWGLPWGSRWLEQRPDVRPLVLVHDMLPIIYPEFFPQAERVQHQRFVAAVARHARGIIVTGEVTRAALQSYLRAEGLRQPPISVIPLATDPIFSSPPEIDAELAAQPYFVACGTIEPRKNHLLLLNIWRELALDMRDATPKLVLVGSRGWENENVLDMLERCEVIRPHVLEVSGLGSSGLKCLLDNSKSLLMPTFAEGYGLPVMEALAAGVPVLASAISAFVPTPPGPIELLDPLDGPGWLEAVRDRAAWPVATAKARINARRKASAQEVCLCRHLRALVGL